MVAGLDRNRVALVLAVLGRHGGIGLGNADVFVNVVGGVRVVEVRVVAPVPVLGLLGPDDRLDVVGRAFLESQ